MLDRLVKLFTSLKLTVVLLALGLLLVFFGTLAQEPLGLYGAQARYFRSFFVDATAFYAGILKLLDMLSQGLGYPLAVFRGSTFQARSSIPVFPGGYLLGTLLLINLFAAHLRYYQPGKRKIGIALIHLGVVMLLVGQLLTDMLSVESTMHIRNGGTKNYSEAGRSFELAVTEATEGDTDKVVAIPGRRLQPGDITHAELPFTVRVKKYFGNSELSQNEAAAFEPVKTTAGIGQEVWWRELPHETEMERRDIPSGIIEVATPQGSAGSFLVSGYLTRPQQFTHAGRTYQLELRPERFYKPFSLHLIEFRHDRYPGTEIPKDFSSLVRLQRPDTGEDRQVRIYMNNPLRYNGETYYQASFDKDDQGTVFQVVRNPGWLTPYLACIIVSAGLLYQFFSHLFKFAAKRKAA